MQDEAHRTSTLNRLAALGHRAEDLRNGPAWQAWLSVARKFRTYSLGNQLLIAFQNPAATMVAGYRTWQRMDRQVRKGEHGIKIFAPMTRKRTAEDGSEERVLTGFKIVRVFDVAQTDGEPLPEQPAWPIVTGAPAGIYRRLVDLVVTHTDLTVRTPEPDQGPVTARGWFLPEKRELWIRDWVMSVGMVPEAQRAKTLLHELAHAFDPGLDRSYRDECELVAESAAWLVCQDLGVEADATVEHYLASWQADGPRVLAVAERVITAADTIRDLVAKGSEAGVASGTEVAA